MVKPDLSVVIPAYNEESRLPRYLGEVTEYLEGKKVCYEVIVVDDGSSDATANLVESLKMRYPHLKLLRLTQNMGKGAAVRAGMLSSEGRLRLFADADGATPIVELERLERAMAAGADIAVASRAVKDQSVSVCGSLHRKIMGTAFNLIVQTLAVPGIRDTQCGFKLFTEQAVDQTFRLQRIDGFGFDVETLFLASKFNLKVAEVPVNWNNIPGTKVSLLCDSYKMLRDIFIVRMNDLRSRYPEGALVTERNA
jgi:dolichyl-phosphate beta-glucosyltransferase